VNLDNLGKLANLEDITKLLNNIWNSLWMKALLFLSN